MEDELQSKIEQDSQDDGDLEAGDLNTSKIEKIKAGPN